MKINCHDGEYLTGLGDLITLSWLAEGAKGTPNEIEFYAIDDKAEFLRMLGQNVTDNKNESLDLSTAYRAELADMGNKPRVDYICNILGVEITPKRPTIAISEEAKKWATDILDKHGRPFVLLFPQTFFQSREWPAAYWIDLSWMLKKQGFHPILLLKNEDKRYANTPAFYFGFNYEKIAALVELADLVICNDSMPAHLGGTLETPTFAVMGPTKPTVFAHMGDSVTTIQSVDMKCVGCHFSKRLYRAACDQGCIALYSVRPNDVFEKVVKAFEDYQMDFVDELRKVYSPNEIPVFRKNLAFYETLLQIAEQYEPKSVTEVNVRNGYTGFTLLYSGAETINSQVSQARGALQSVEFVEQRFDAEWNVYKSKSFDLKDDVDLVFINTDGPEIPLYDILMKAKAVAPVIVISHVRGGDKIQEAIAEFKEYNHLFEYNVFEDGGFGIGVFSAPKMSIIRCE